MARKKKKEKVTLPRISAYKNIIGYKINVNARPMEAGDVHELEETQEVLNLVKQKYLEEVTEDE